MEASAATQPHERQRLPPHHARDRLADPGGGVGVHTTNVTDPFPEVKWNGRIPPTDWLGGGEVTEHQHPSRFHEWFDHELTDRGWGDREAGRRIGINHVTVGGIRNGSTRQPSLEVVTKIAATLEHDVPTLRRWLAEQAGADQVTPEPATAAASTAAPEMVIGDAAMHQVEMLIERAVERATETLTERVVERLHEVLTPINAEEMSTALQRAGITDAETLDDRIPVMFSGVIWEELTDAEKAGVIALAKRLMGRPAGRMGRRTPD